MENSFEKKEYRMEIIEKKITEKLKLRKTISCEKMKLLKKENKHDLGLKFPKDTRKIMKENKFFIQS